MSFFLFDHPVQHLLQMVLGYSRERRSRSFTSLTTKSFRLPSLVWNVVSRLMTFS